MRAVVGKDDDGASEMAHAPGARSLCFPEGACQVRNRTVLAAMTNKQSHDDGTASEDEIKWLEARSRGQFGIMTTAATHVLNNGQGWEGEFGTWSDDHLDGLERMANAIARHGAVGLAQLFHGGMRAPKQLTGLQPMSASINELGGDLGQSRAMTEEDIHEVIDGFGAAAARCERAGFHGVELHGAHGYLLTRNFSEQAPIEGTMRGVVHKRSAHVCLLKSCPRFAGQPGQTFSWASAFHPNSEPAA